MSGLKYFTPKIATHSEFGEALIKAEQAGVKTVAFEYDVAENNLMVTKPVEVKLC
jgi:sugar fermentation stimulation protein A